MKDRPDAILRSPQARYLESLLPARDPILREMEEEGARHDVPISDPEVGRLLEILARSKGPRLIVEVGTAIGYGTLCLARGAPEARVVSIDFDPERLATARGYLERAGVADRVELVEGAALDVLARPGGFGGAIDFVYLDAVKTEYRQYLELLVPLMSVGGLVVMDNLLWKGWVAEPPADGSEDDATRALRELNGELMRHPRLQALVLPLGDGLGVATVL